MGEWLPCFTAPALTNEAIIQKEAENIREMRETLCQLTVAVH